MHHPDDVQGVVDEIHHVAELPGMVSVFMRPNPAIEWRYFNDPVYDPIWSALQDTELPVAFHPFLAPDLPGACEGLKLARVRDADGSYQSLDEFEAAEAATGGAVPPEHLLHPGDRQPRRRDERDLLHHLRRRRRAVPGRQVHVPRGQRRLARAVARAARPPREEVQLGRAVAEDAARRSTSAGSAGSASTPTSRCSAFTANSPLCGADRIIWASDYPHPDAKFPGVTEELTEALAGLTVRAEARDHERERARPLRHHMST